MLLLRQVVVGNWIVAEVELFGRQRFPFVLEWKVPQYAFDLALAGDVQTEVELRLLGLQRRAFCSRSKLR